VAASIRADRLVRLLAAFEPPNRFGGSTEVPMPVYFRLVELVDDDDPVYADNGLSAGEGGSLVVFTRTRVVLVTAVQNDFEVSAFRRRDLDRIALGSGGAWNGDYGQSWPEGRSIVLTYASGIDLTLPLAPRKASELAAFLPALLADLEAG
jgi:hypothetical protein